jgi:hypothetical protein
MHSPVLLSLTPDRWRFRVFSAALPRIVAFRKAANAAKNDHVADANSFRLEKMPGVRERIEYLTHGVVRCRSPRVGVGPDCIGPV